MSIGRWFLLATLALALPARADPPDPAPAAVPDAPRARLVVVLKGLKSADGVARISLYAGEEGFPSKREHSLKGGTAEIRDGEARLAFDDLAPGTYGVSAFHDEDADGKLKRGIFGIPTEGIAFSRDARNPVGPPKWKDARFDLPPGETTITCNLRY